MENKSRIGHFNLMIGYVEIILKIKSVIGNFNSFHGGKHQSKCSMNCLNSFCKTTQKSWDIIISTLSNPCILAKTASLQEPFLNAGHIATFMEKKSM